MKNPIYKIKNVIYKKGSNTVLNIKNFEMHRGACYTISGEMSSGKTLLLKLLSKELRGYKGDVIFDGDDIGTVSNKNLSKEISIVSQLAKRPFFITVRKYIENEIRKKHNDSTVQKKINHIVTVMDIKYLLKEKVRNLSPGQFRWIDLAAKIASYPKILMIDEIEMHLSKKNRECLSKILYRKCNYDGVSLIMTTQNADFFKNLTSVNVNLNQGRITRLRSFSNRTRKKH